MDIGVLLEKGVEPLKKCGRIKLSNGLSGFAARKYNGEDLAAATQSTVICSLYAAGYLTDQEIECYLSELKKLQIVSGINSGSWCSEERSSVWATTKSINTFLIIFPNLIQEKFLISSLEWLIKQRNSDGGWGYKKGSHSRPYYTYYVMMTEIMAYNCTQEAELKTKLKESLYQDIIFLQSLHVGNGKWKSARAEDICPASTLVALCVFKKYDQLFNTSYFDNNNFKEGISYVREYIYKNPAITFKEDNLNWAVDFFLPGKIDLVLQLFDIDDKATQSLVEYLKNSYVVTNDNFGWVLNENEIIYTWTTAMAIKSLSDYLNNIKKQDIKKIQDMEKNIISEMQDEIFNLRKKFHTTLIALFILILFNIIYSLILPNYEKISSAFFAVGIDTPLVIYTIVGVMILSIIDEFTKKWTRRFCSSINKYITKR